MGTIADKHFVLCRSYYSEAIFKIRFLVYENDFKNVIIWQLDFELPPPHTHTYHSLWSEGGLDEVADGNSTHKRGLQGTRKTQKVNCLQTKVRSTTVHEATG